MELKCAGRTKSYIVASHGNYPLPTSHQQLKAAPPDPQERSFSWRAMWCGSWWQPLGALDVEKLTKEIPHVFWNYITWFNIHAPVQQYRLLGHSWCYKEIWQYSKGCLHDLGSTIVTSICISLVQYSKSSLWNMKPSSYICMLDPCDQTPRRFIRPIFMLLPRSLKTEAHEKNWAGAPEGWKVKVPHL